MKKPKGTDAVFTALVESARRMRTVTYEDLGAAAGLPAVSMGSRVGYIRDAVCRPRGLPWLSVIAVSKKTGRPGNAFLPDGMSLDDQDLETWWRAMVLLVFSTDWSGVECRPPQPQPDLSQKPKRMVSL